MSGRLGCFLALALVGCSGGDPGATQSSGSTAASCGVTVMAQNCTFAGCHGISPGSPPQAHLDLSSAALGDGHQLVNAPAQGSFCAQSSTPPPLIIDPHTPEKSLLYNKLQAPPVCGPEMPYLRQPLSPANQQCILDWIKTVPGVQ
jgi:hypothetical protein